MPIDPDYAPDIPESVSDFCRAQTGGDIVSTETFKSGQISTVRRLTTESGDSFILKQSRNLPADLYAREADGLRALQAAGTRTPQVYDVQPNHLLMEDVGAVPVDDALWEAFGRALAFQHQHTSDRYGYPCDNYLGMYPQWNAWNDDGRAFFARNRILRYVAIPLGEQSLTADDRRAIDRLIDRLPSLIPYQPPSLLHGDLWFANMLADSQGQPTAIDPAVYYGWPEAELSMTYMCGTVAPVFFDAYQEIHPLADGWRERMEILHIREYMGMIAHFGNAYGSVDHLRAMLAKFA